MEITGTVNSIGNVEAISENFKKLNLIVDCTRFNPENGDKYENFVKIEVQNGKINDLNGFKVGEKIKVHFNVKGRFWVNEKTSEQVHIQNLVAYKFEKL